MVVDEENGKEDEKLRGVEDGMQLGLKEKSTREV